MISPLLCSSGFLIFMNYFMDKNPFGNEQGSDRENRPVAWKRDLRVVPAHYPSDSTRKS